MKNSDRLILSLVLCSLLALVWLGAATRVESTGLPGYCGPVAGSAYSTLCPVPLTDVGQAYQAVEDNCQEVVEALTFEIKGGNQVEAYLFVLRDIPGCTPLL